MRLTRREKRLVLDYKAEKKSLKESEKSLVDNNVGLLKNLADFIVATFSMNDTYEVSDKYA